MGELIVVIALIFYILFLVGYIMNIVKIISTIREPVSLLHTLRLIGIAVPPLGSVLGWVF